MDLRSGTLRLFWASVLWASAASLVVAAEPPVHSFVAVSQPLAAQPILPAGAPQAAAALTQEAHCHPTVRRTANVALSWAPGNAAVPVTQRVDITKFREGFDTERYDTTGPLAATVSAVTVEAPEPGIHYYWRVLTETPEGWAPSVVGRFEVPVCPYDPPDLERFEGHLNPGSLPESSGSSAQEGESR